MEPLGWMADLGIYSVPEIQPSAVTDQEIINLLRARYEWYKSKLKAVRLSRFEVHARLAKLSPWELPSCFVVGQPISQASGWKTTHGSWKVKDDGGCQISAIRSDSAAADHPRYVGVKTTMEYHLRNGTKTDWVMVIHNMLTFKEQAAGFFIEDEFAFCKVLEMKRKGHMLNEAPLFGLRSSSPPIAPAPESFFEDIDFPLIDFQFEDDYMDNEIWRASVHELAKLFNSCDEEEYFENEYQQLLSKQQAEEPNMNSQQFANNQRTEQRKTKKQQGANEQHDEQPKKRPKPSTGDGKSRVWDHYTKIYTEDRNVMYAACHACDGMFKAHSKNGTTHLWRHAVKHCPALQQPAQQPGPLQ